MILKDIKDFVAQALQNLAVAHDVIIKACIFQICNVNQCRSTGPNIQKGMPVDLSTKNLTLPNERVRKLCSKWVGQYKVLEVYEKTSN